MSTVRMVTTAGLTRAEQAALRDLMDAAFDGEFGDEDWDHALGGLHFLLTEGSRPVAHAAVVQRRFRYDGRPLRCGYVEAVAVRPDRQRQGLGAAVMAAAEHEIDGGYHLGALSASEAGHDFYLARGWTLWQGPTAVLAPSGVTRTPEDDDSTFVRQTPTGPALRPDRELVCDWRDGDVW